MGVWSKLFSRYCPIELAVAENTLFALPPINRSVPTTITKMTASITAYSAISCPSSCDQSLRRKSVIFAPLHDFNSIPQPASTGRAKGDLHWMSSETSSTGEKSLLHSLILGPRGFECNRLVSTTDFNKSRSSLGSSATGALCRIRVLHPSAWASEQKEGL